MSHLTLRVCVCIHWRPTAEAILERRLKAAADIRASCQLPSESTTCYRLVGVHSAS